MGMMFGGWFEETEEIVNDRFGGDWAAYEEWHKKEMERIAALPPKVWEYSSTEPHVTEWDVIGKWDPIKKTITDEFWVKEIVQGKIFGIFTDNGMDGATVEWNLGEYKKMCSVQSEIK